MFSDFHIHSEFSGDSTAPVKGQIEQSIRLGMKQICMTDHHDYDMPHEIDFTLDTAAYVPAITELAVKYQPQIRLYTGVELGLQEHIKDYLDDYVKSYDFDFVIGSTHVINGVDPYYPCFYEGRQESEAYLEYFQHTLRNALLHDCYDVYGHLDYVVRYGPNKDRFYSYQQYQEILDAILKAIIAKGKGIECNGAGLKYGLSFPNPHLDIIKRYFQLGGEILTIGSDGHCPEHIGYGFSQIHKMLKSIGVRYYTIFEKRKPIFLPLE